MKNTDKIYEWVPKSRDDDLLQTQYIQGQPVQMGTHM